MVNLNEILTVIVLLPIFWNGLKGLSRGFGRQVVRIILTVVAAVAAYISTIAMSENLMAMLTPESIKGYIAGLNTAGLPIDLTVIADYLTSVDLLVQLPMGAIFSPIVFATTFFAYKALVPPVSAFIYGIFGIEKPDGESAKVIPGLFVGIAEGLVSAFIILVPFSGILGVADDSIDVLREREDTRYEAVISAYDEYVGNLGDHFAIQTANQIGAQKLIDKFAYAKIDGHDVDLRAETVKIVDLVIEFTTIGSVNFVEPTEDNKVAIESVVKHLEDSDYLTLLFSGIFSDVGRAFNDGIAPIAVPAPYDIIVNPTLTMFATINADNFRADLDTVLEIYFLLADSGVLKAFGQEGQEQTMTDAFISADETGKTVISRVVDILNKNPHMSPVVQAITDMSLMMLQNQLGMDVDNIVETYENIKDGVNDVLALNPDDYATPDEYVEARNEALDATLTENGIELEPEIVDGIGDYIDENFSDVEELTDEQISDIILSYYDVYMQNQGEGTNP